jgi:hypothetical protein
LAAQLVIQSLKEEPPSSIEVDGWARTFPYARPHRTVVLTSQYGKWEAAHPVTVEDVSAVPFEKQADVHAQILDIIGAAGGQPDFDCAVQLIDQKFQTLCIQPGCPLVSVTWE